MSRITTTETIPQYGWRSKKNMDWQCDDTLTLNSKLPVYPDTLPEKVTLSSRGPAADTHPTAMGVYSRLQGLPPVWEHSISTGHKLFYDGKNRKFIKIKLKCTNQAQDGS